MTKTRLPWAAIASLGVTQILGYGMLYYSFSILAADMALDFGGSVEWIFGMLSVALLVGGVAAPWFGRWIDQFGAGRVMTVGTLAAALSLIGCAFSPDRATFGAMLIAVEVSASLVQYGAAFALLIQLRPDVAQRSITCLTLIAGFASTIFWPITTALHGYLSWQQVYLAYAGLNLLICLPIHAWLSRLTRPSRNGVKAQGAAAETEGLLASDLRRIGFVLMLVGFALQALTSSAILVHMVPLLGSLGLGAAAALVGSLFGPAQVASRLINMLLGRDLPALQLAVISAVLMVASAAVLAMTAPSTPGAMVFAALFGFGNGLFSIVGGTLPLVLFGSRGYGRLQGKAMSARLIASAIAPFAFAVAMEQVGATWSLTAVCAIGLANIASFLAIARLLR